MHFDYLSATCTFRQLDFLGAHVMLRFLTGRERSRQHHGKKFLEGRGSAAPRHGGFWTLPMIKNLSFCRSKHGSKARLLQVAALRLVRPRRMSQSGASAKI